ncbi:MAG TPA: hypothetical protein VKN36_15355 [Eudoraea sp.]|nr:hypothetical protein [Eudoraea sp.]
MRLKLCLLVLVLFFICPEVIGQKYKYVHFQGEAVPFQQVNQVIQDTNGYVWLATDDGLFRFDGSSFEDFNISLRSKTIRGFVSFDENTILFTNDTGIYSIKYQEGNPAIEPFSEAPGLHYPTELFQDSRGRVWAGQMNGSVFMYSSTEANGMRFEPVPEEKTAHIFFGEDIFNTVWALIPKNGIFYFDEAAQKFSAAGNQYDVSHFLVADDVLWLVGDHIKKLAVSEGGNVVGETNFSVNRKYRRIAKNRSGTIFLATESDLYTFRNTENGPSIKKIFGSNDPHRVDELPFKTISNLHFTFDTSNLTEAIWVSSGNGLGLLWSGFFQGLSGLANDNILALCPTDGGQILVSQGNITRVDVTGSSIGFKKDNALNGITGITSHKNITWYGTGNGQILQVPEQGPTKKIDLSRRGGGIFFMNADHQGDVWLCQAPLDKPIMGAARLNKDGTIVEYGTEKGFDSRVLVVREGGRNELYAAGIGTGTYLYKYDRTSDEFVNKSLVFPFEVSGNFEVHDMAVDNLGIVWLATTDGLLKYDTETIRRVNLGEYTLSEIRSVTSMSDGTLWLATDTDGLIHLDASSHYVLFDEKSGTPSKVASYRCLALDSDSRLWVGTAEGVVYSSQLLPGPQETKTPVLRSVVIGEEEVSTGEEIQITETEVVQLAVATITYPSTDIGYQYKVFQSDLHSDEIDDIIWTETETARFRLNGLTSGTYKVYVRGQKEGGYSWSKPLQMMVNVSELWYHRWWALLSFAILGFLFFWYFVRRWFLNRIGSLNASLLQKQNELNIKEAEIAAQIDTIKHQREEIKNTGTNIYLLNRLLRQFPKNATWKTMITALRQLVELPTGIDAFEIAYKRGENIIYSGYERGKKTIINRQEEFNEKENLASCVMVTGKSLMLNDFEKESISYISGRDSRGFISRLLHPLENSNGTPVVLCIYARQKDAFSQRDMTLIQILAAFLAVNAKDQLK